MTTTFESVKVGDRVWDSRLGWGVVDEVICSSDYPIIVDFGHECESYTLGGYYSEGDLNPSLFWGEVKIEAPSKPLPDLEVDAKVLVWDNGRDRFSRHFSHFSKDGVLHTFSHGKTSFTGAGHTTPWDNWELAE